MGNPVTPVNPVPMNPVAPVRSNPQQRQPTPPMNPFPMNPVPPVSAPRNPVPAPVSAPAPFNPVPAPVPAPFNPVSSNQFNRGPTTPAVPLNPYTPPVRGAGFARPTTQNIASLPSMEPVVETLPSSV